MDDGGVAVTTRGVCWSTFFNPTTADSVTNDGGGTGAFTSSITGLSPGTHYHVRAYATNSHGTYYGNDISFTTTAYNLYVKSTPETGADITVSPNDIYGNGNGITDFTRQYAPGTAVTLTAPAIYNGKNFIKWQVDNADRPGQTITVTMDGHHTARAIYRASTYTLTVQSSPYPGASITVSPNDNNNQGNGSTDFYRTYDSGTIITLQAPASHDGKNFVKWRIDGEENTNSTIKVTMNSNHTVQAIFQSTTYTLTVKSSPYTNVKIKVSPADNNENGDGKTEFSRTYDAGTQVTLTAPPSFEGRDFIKWTIDGQDNIEPGIQLTMDGNHTAAAYYETSRPPQISVNRQSLNFAYIIGGNEFPGETFTISNSGGGTLDWTVNTELQRASLNPGSGSNCGTVQITIDPVGLIPGEYISVIYVSAPLVSNSPQEVQINLRVMSQPDGSPPFGVFSTPVNFSYVSGSVPVTGWTLGNTGIESVKIYREQGAGLDYIGDAVMVEGARPDVETSFPHYPMNYKAGWGYMMLTNFLPGGGNGTFKIHAIATDKEGRSSTLGVKTIYVDNANAVKPFGAIDTPGQGGRASGSNFINWGWVLTPRPNSIPIDGSTINVYVDGVNTGHPIYNIYREDIAGLFPDYANTGGATGYFYLDTTAYQNGIHTIQWTATDSAGNTDGIGSRYFTVQNECVTSWSDAGLSTPYQKTPLPGMAIDDLKTFPIDYLPLKINKGYSAYDVPIIKSPGNDGTVEINIKELERLEIQLTADNWLIDGYLAVGGQLKPLPTGSFLDKGTGIFYWQPGVGFYGTYDFVFIKANGTERRNVRLKVNILPGFSNEGAAPPTPKGPSGVKR